jgi:hypothetical protein
MVPDDRDSFNVKCPYCNEMHAIQKEESSSLAEFSNKPRRIIRIGYCPKFDKCFEVELEIN